MFKLFKVVRRKIYRNSALLRKLWFWIKFVKRNKYIPNFKKPKTYNEKINYRKNNPKNPLFSICSDKIKAKEYVAKIISPDIIIPNYYVGDSITLEQMKKIIQEKGGCVLKANHNSGPVHLLSSTSSDADIRSAVDSTMEQLKVDFGVFVNEPWYSDIKPGVLVEKRLEPESGETDIRDYKFHVFKQKDGSCKIILAAFFERTNNRSGSYFDEDLNYLNISNIHPTIYTKANEPKNYKLMKDIALKLAEPFTYVRVDFYNINGAIYFGELTFADGSGGLSFNSYAHDLWMGNLWQGDPSW